MRKTKRSTEPITPQNLPGTSSPVVNLNVESDKRLSKKVSTEDAYNDLNIKRPEDLQKEIENRKPGQDVDPNESVSQE
ncbi:hypothetical protein [Pseudochryseolinea flava]|uniref:Uncharacterized protein n=1 Tax=Pseudochryseolinea flava TaxID=2059302 RepID=A0A364Y1K5_9BACT|nr:hypothetical protein [Pseudochryseolinea flava]RAV99829.1 hypothetical protein DQQ10_17455 [Pseudochryseolinea flava]